MFWKKKKLNCNLITYNSQEYNHTIGYVHNVINKSYSNDEKTDVIDFFCKMISKDLQYDFLTTIFYSENYFKKDIRLIMPIYVYDKAGEQIELVTRQYKELDLATDCVVTLPWHRERMINSILNLKKRKWQFDETNHQGYYYKDLNFGYVYNGRHSTAGGIGYQQGKMPFQVIDISKAYEHLYTDGCQWYNKHTRKIILDVQDFRVAILYELNRLKSELK